VALRIYDNLTREKREFVPVRPGHVGMYVCGMTVQDKPHIGHIRASLSGDLLRRYLLHLGYQVTYVYNFTDVDDKIIARANAEHVDFESVSERNIAAYLRGADQHNIMRATHYPRATAHIDDMFALIARLIERGHAYAAGGDVYFDVRSKADYGKLSRRDVDELRAGERAKAGDATNVGVDKRDVLDFALWKGAKPGEPAWESPWGPGRPGWHIECSAMSMKYLGETFDIHGGGVDLVFPHHENEIAQSEAATGRPFANFWTENGLVNVALTDPETGERKAEKISKSTGTGQLFFIDDIADRVDPEVVRYYLLSTHYRSPIDFSEQRLAEAAVAYQRLRSPLERADAWSVPADSRPGGELGEAVTEAERVFCEAMDDDFNSAKAIGHLFDLSRAVNRALDEGLGAEARAAARELLRLGGVLGLFWRAPGAANWSAEVLELASQREAARKRKDWAASDALRRQLHERGVLVEDTPQGQKLKPR
jgi:cysteinyl-tRNA synthetase